MGGSAIFNVHSILPSRHAQESPVYLFNWIRVGLESSFLNTGRKKDDAWPLALCDNFADIMQVGRSGHSIHLQTSQSGKPSMGFTSLCSHQCLRALLPQQMPQNKLEAIQMQTSSSDSSFGLFSFRFWEQTWIWKDFNSWNLWVEGSDRFQQQCRTRLIPKNLAIMPKLR